MSNRITVRRVMFQDLNDDGTPDGPPTYGVLASDSYESGYNNTFESLDELNAEIEKRGCILNIVQDSGDPAPFSDIDTKATGIGTNNFYGQTVLY